MNAFLSIADYLADNTYEGRLVMIYVSGGFSLRPGQNYFDMVDKALEDQAVAGTEDMLVFRYRPSNDFELEVRDAIGLLSDGGFKLFVYVCLHADRRTAQLRFRIAELAKAVGHSTRSLTTYLDELDRAGVGAVYRASNQHELGRVEILDRFWPYNKESGDSTTDPEQAHYVARVRQWYLEQACVTSAFGAADEKLAGEWYRSGISLDVVGRAFLLGCARKYVALFNNARRPVRVRVRSSTPSARWTPLLGTRARPSSARDGRLTVVVPPVGQ